MWSFFKIQTLIKKILIQSYGSSEFIDSHRILEGKFSDWAVFLSYKSFKISQSN